MNIVKYIFAQVIDFRPRCQFDKLVKKYKGDWHAKDLSCYSQLLHLLFGQITGCVSIRGICLCLEAHGSSNILKANIPEELYEETFGVSNIFRTFASKYGYPIRSLSESSILLLSLDLRNCQFLHYKDNRHPKRLRDSVGCAYM